MKAVIDIEYATYQRGEADELIIKFVQDARAFGLVVNVDTSPLTRRATRCSAGQDIRQHYALRCSERCNHGGASETANPRTIGEVLS